MENSLLSMINPHSLPLFGFEPPVKSITVCNLVLRSVYIIVSELNVRSFLV